ncbi:MAG: DUF1553 domain-containing protein, partial [Planctomycetales bacterium]|nr:DUF1553 domain-containing protein [Planctomycetales bacterium]
LAEADKTKMLMDILDEQINTTGVAFMGLTFGCARCHEHKFDPISMRDYYALAAHLRTARQDIARLDPNGELTQAVSDMLELRAEVSDQWVASFSETTEPGDQVVRYVLAALECLEADGDGTDPRNEVEPDWLFADFEADSYEPWEREGTAFGDQPVEGSYPGQLPVSGYVGKRLANSFSGGDGALGALRSPTFTIDRKFVQMRVGGGSLSGLARVALIVDGEEVLSTSGLQNELLEPVVWDVRPWLGQTARIDIIDADPFGWGHVNVDQIVFSNEPTPYALPGSIDAIARKHRLDPELLLSWVVALIDRSTARPDHPLHPLRDAHDGANREAPRVVWTRHQESPSLSVPVTPDGAVELFDDQSEWYESGQAFQSALSATPAWAWHLGMPRAADARLAHSGLISEPLSGVLRSPTFTLTHDSLRLRVAGHRGKVRLVICRYELRPVNPLLFTETLFDVNTNGRWEWRQLHADIKRYVGLPVYLELIDEGDGFVALDRAVMIDHAVDNRVLERTVDSQVEREDWIRGLGERLNQSRRAWLESQNGTAASFWCWVDQRGLWERPDGPAPWRAIAARQLEAESAARVAPLRALTMTMGSAEPSHVFVRGNHRQPAEQVECGFLSALPGVYETEADARRSRLALAAAMAKPDNPLAHRVWVNRVWAHLFGRGIVPTVDNFGAMGRAATHPELLDWMVVRFREHDASLKQLVRDLCLSRTFAMSTTSASPLADQLDAANDWLHVQRVRRLEGETLRDHILVMSDALDGRAFGPSVPTHLTPFMGDPFWLGTRGIGSGPLDGDRRRSVYLEVRRNFLSPWMITFDFPIPDSTVGARNDSNVPAQSLALMNDPFVTLHVQRCADGLLGIEGASDAERIEELYLRALARVPREAETRELIEFLERQRRHYEDQRLADAERLAWVDLCHVIVMQKEFRYVW